MMQTFNFSNGLDQSLRVVDQRSYTYESGLTIQISKILWHYVDQIPQYRYVYEEISTNDFVIYCRYMGIDNIERAYPWAIEEVSA